MNTAEIEVEEVLHETAAALLCLIEGEEVWVPKSVIDGGSEIKTKRDGAESSLLVVAKWWAHKNGLTD